jgi:hypothetical protein
MLLSLVASSLMHHEDLHVVQAAAWEEIGVLSAVCTPDVLIFDLSAAYENHILTLLFKNPGLLLIGLDVETNRAVLLSGKEARSLTLERMKEIVLTY